MKLPRRIVGLVKSRLNIAYDIRVLWQKRYLQLLLFCQINRRECNHNILEVRVEVSDNRLENLDHCSKVACDASDYFRKRVVTQVKVCTVKEVAFAQNVTVVNIKPGRKYVQAPQTNHQGSG